MSNFYNSTKAITQVYKYTGTRMIFAETVKSWKPTKHPTKDKNSRSLCPVCRVRMVRCVRRAPG